MQTSRTYWRNFLIVGLLLVLIVGGPTVPAQAAPSRAPQRTLAPGTVLINEFVPAPQTVFTQEKVELYNTTASPVTIGGLWIDDIANGGSAPQQIPAGTTIAGHGFYVHSLTSYLNNGGDDVRLLDTDGTTVLDAYTYTASPGYDASYGRTCDGGAWTTTPNPSPTIGASNGTCSSSGTWTPGTLAVYVFDVEQGDSQLIVSPSGKTLLIDVSEPSWNTGANAAAIAGKLRTIMGSSFSHLDYILATHLHLDHIGYAGYGGIWGLIETQGFSVGKLIDRDAGVWVDGNSDGVCDPDTEIVWHNAGTLSGTAGHWVCYVTDPANASKLHREVATVGSTTQIDLGPEVIVKVVQRDAENVMMVDGVTPVRGDHTADALPPSENDYSIGIQVTYGLFDYVTSGDTDGEYATSSYGYVYNDVETIAAPRYGDIDVLHINHHGSSHSSNQVYIDTLSPEVSLISCGSNTYGHPDQSTLDRLLATSAVYITNLCDPTRNYGASVIANGDIVVQSTDGTNYTVNGVPYAATNPAPPQQASFLSLAAEDGYISESSETSNVGGTAYATGTTVRAGDDASDRQWLSILSFDTSSLPDNAIVQTVELRLRRTGVVGTSPFSTHGNLWVDVKNGYYGTSSSLVASDFEAASTATQVTSLSEPPANGEWASGSFNSAGLAAVNRTGRTQVKMRFNLDDNDDMSNDYMGFSSGEATTSSRPTLIVTYRMP